MSDGVRFRDRRAAGEQLAAELAGRGLERPLVLALPRGGVPVAAPVAERLGAPLDVWVVRKVGAPGHEEFGIGAIAEGGGSVFDRRTIDALQIDDALLARLVDTQRVELERRVERYRGDRARPDPAGLDVVLVDDGLATGVTAEAAIRAVLDRKPHRLVLAVPVAAADTVMRLSELTEVVVVATPPDFTAVGRWYRDFSQTTDAEVVELLAASRRTA